MEPTTIRRETTVTHGHEQTTCRSVLTETETQTVYQQDCYGETVTKTPKAKVPADLAGHEGAAGLTFTAGQVDGKDVFTFGGRLEGGKTLVGGESARLATVGAVHLGVGNALLAGGGLGLKAELGPKNLNVYGTAMGTVNAGITANGLTAGVGVRGAAGAQVGVLYGEVAHEVATNGHTTSATAGLRFRF